MQDARRRSETRRPPDWTPEDHHPLGNGESVIPDALLHYCSGDARFSVSARRTTRYPGGPVLSELLNRHRARTK